MCDIATVRCCRICSSTATEDGLRTSRMLTGLLWQSTTSALTCLRLSKFEGCAFCRAVPSRHMTEPLAPRLFLTRVAGRLEDHAAFRGRERLHSGTPCTWPVLYFSCAGTHWLYSIVTSGVNNVNQGNSLLATSVSAGASASPACSYADSDVPAESTCFHAGHRSLCLDG